MSFSLFNHVPFLGIRILFLAYFYYVIYILREFKNKFALRQHSIATQLVLFSLLVS